MRITDSETCIGCGSEDRMEYYDVCNECRRKLRFTNDYPGELPGVTSPMTYKELRELVLGLR